MWFRAGRSRRSPENSDFISCRQGQPNSRQRQRGSGGDRLSSSSTATFCIEFFYPDTIPCDFLSDFAAVRRPAPHVRPVQILPADQENRREKPPCKEGNAARFLVGIPAAASQKGRTAPRRNPFSQSRSARNNVGFQDFISGRQHGSASDFSQSVQTAEQADIPSVSACPGSIPIFPPHRRSWRSRSPRRSAHPG